MRGSVIALLAAALLAVLLWATLPRWLRPTEERGARRMTATGRTLLLEGNESGAIAAFRDALRRDPGNPRAARSLADLLFEQADWEGARALYQTARRGGEKDAALLRKLGLCALNADDPEGAVEPLRAALAAGGGDAPRIRIPLALALHRTGDDAGAEDALVKALEEDPRDVEGIMALGNLREEQERDAEAIMLYARAGELVPRAVEPRKRRGAVLARLGRYREAQAAYGEALALDPNDTDTLILLGNAHEGLNEPAEARYYFESALRIDPKSFLATLDLAGLAMREGKTLEASSLLERAMEMDPTSPLPPLFLGRLLAARGNRTDALALAGKACELGPNLAEPRVDLAALLLPSDPKGAEEALREGIALDPGHAEAHRMLARLLLDRGEREQALTHLRLALARQPDDPQAHALLLQIEKTAPAPSAAAPATRPATNP